MTAVPPPLAGVDRDLDTVVQMALRKESERRYSSVEQFAADIKRYLTGFPVTARPDTWGYRFRKFARRNRIGLAAALLALVALVGGSALIAWQARIAERRFAQVRKLANSLTLEIDDAVKQLPGATPARRVIVKRALEYLDGLVQERHGDKQLTRELADAYFRVGEVQGSPNVPNLGDYTGALDAFGKAASLLEPLAKENRLDALVALSEVDDRVFQLAQYKADLKLAAKTLQKQIALTDRLARGWPNDRKVLFRRTMTYIEQADLAGNADLPNRGSPKDSLPLYEKALDLLLKLPPGPKNELEQFELPAVYARIATVKRTLADWPGAAEAFQKAISLDEELVRQDPLRVVTRREVAVYSRTLAMTLDTMKRFPEALKAGTRSHELFLQLAREDPANASAQEALGDSYFTQAKFELDNGLVKEAQRNCDLSVESYLKLMATHPEMLLYGLRTAYQVAVEIAVKLDQPRKAVEYGQKELEFADRILAKEPASVNGYNYRGIALRDIARAYEARTSWREAKSYYERSLEVWTSLNRQGRLVPSYANQIDRISEALARCDRALTR